MLKNKGKFNIYEPIQKDLEDRVKAINSGQELWLAIEGRYTNLRIWKSRLHAPINPDNTEGIFMRLDKANNYSTPLSVETHGYLDNQNSPVSQLVKFDFPTSIDNLNEILEITKNMIIRRDIVAW